MHEFLFYWVIKSTQFYDFLSVNKLGMLGNHRVKKKKLKIKILNVVYLLIKNYH
jgi:hypothetical protein